MKKGKRRKEDDLRPDYDFSSMRGGVRGKYVARLKKGSNLVLLDPDVASAFHSDAAVNDVLRAVLRASQALRRHGPQPKQMQRTRAVTARHGRRPVGAGRSTPTR